MEGEFSVYLRALRDVSRVTSQQIAAKRGVRPEQLSRIVNAPQVSAIEGFLVGKAYAEALTEAQKRSQRVNAG